MFVYLLYIYIFFGMMIPFSEGVDCMNKLPTEYAYSPSASFFSGGYKERVYLVKGDNKYRYAIAGRNITGSSKRKLKDLFCFKVVIEGQTLLLNKMSACRRLGIERKELNLAIKEGTVEALIQGKIKAAKTGIGFKWNKELTLDQHQLIGSHNSWISGAYGWWVHNQNMAIRQQLNMGVRLLELDIEAKKKGGALEVVHDNHKKSCIQKRGPYQTCRGALLEVKKWLDQNREEVLVIKLDNKRDRNSKMNTIDKVIEEAGLQGDVFRPGDFEGKEWPKIGEMKRRLVIINSKTPKTDEENSIYTHFAGHTLAETVGGVTGFALKRGEAYSSIPAQKGAKFSDVHQHRNKLLVLNYSRKIPQNTFSMIAKIISKVLHHISTVFNPKKHTSFVKATEKKITRLQEKYQKYDSRKPSFMGDRVETLLTEDFFKKVNEYNGVQEA